MTVIDVSEATFEAEVIERSRTITSASKVASLTSITVTSSILRDR